MKTKLKLMGESETKDVVNALLRWFESQDIGPYDAFSILVQATGTVLGMLSRDEKELKSGLVAIQKDLKVIAKDTYTGEHGKISAI